MPATRMRNGFLDNLPDLGFDDGSQRRKTKDPQPVPPEDIMVEYIQIKCPKCGSTKCPVYNSNHIPVRYHKCTKCGLAFKSVEKHT